jgi:hypothetical protein
LSSSRSRPVAARMRFDSFVRSDLMPRKLDLPWHEIEGGRAVTIMVLADHEGVMVTRARQLLGLGSARRTSWSDVRQSESERDAGERVVGSAEHPIPTTAPGYEPPSAPAPGTAAVRRSPAVRAGCPLSRGLGGFTLSGRHGAKRPGRQYLSQLGRSSIPISLFDPASALCPEQWRPFDAHEPASWRAIVTRRKLRSLCIDGPN